MRGLLNRTDYFLYAKGWLGTLITIGLTCIATLINVFEYKKLPIMEVVAIPLYFAVFIALVRVVPNVE